MEHDLTSRTGSLPVRGGSRTGGPPVQDEHRTQATRSAAPTPLLYEFPDAMSTASEHYFSRFGNPSVHTRNLPHWAANDTLIFITYRLADSMPADKLREWQGARDEWLSQHPQPWDGATADEYHSLFSEKLEILLDAGYGACTLKRDDCRQTVVENLLHFNLTRYRLHAFVVMPNHVHILMEIAARDDLPKIVHSWKSYTAKRINALTGGEGEVWQKEYFDRLVRNAEHYAKTIEYIRRNARSVKR